MKDRSPSKPFWETKNLGEMNQQEWESLCDGCAKCCLHKFQDALTGTITNTNVVCRLLDLDTCTCTRYAERQRLVPNCIVLDKDNVGELDWMPSTCAYRLLSEGKPLPDWHPLISGDPDTIHGTSGSIRGRVVSEREAGELSHYLVDWDL